MNNVAVDVYRSKTGQYQAVLPVARTTTAPGLAYDGAYGMPSAAPTEARTPLPDELVSGRLWAWWGENDQFPTEVRNKMELVPSAGRAIYQKVAMLYGSGLKYYRRDELYNADGAQVPRASIRKIDDWLQRNRILQSFMVPQAGDYSYYMNAFSEMVFSRDYKQITNIFHKTAEHCRRSIQNPTTLRSEYLLFSRRFGLHIPTPQEVLRVPMYDYTDPETFFRRLRGHKMAWHSQFETPGSIYYARPFWLGLFRKAGWLDVSAAVPETIVAMMRNQIALKYQIIIPLDYFRMRYPEWEAYTFEQKNKLFDELVDKINTSLSGTSNALKSLALLVDTELGTNNLRGKIEIIPVDDRTKEGHWVPSSERSDLAIYTALGVHPNQVGLSGQGGTMGSGSGSDQREAYNTGITLNTIDQDILLEPLNYIARWNAQYDPDWDVIFVQDHQFHTTTNAQESGIQPPDDAIMQQ